MSEIIRDLSNKLTRELEEDLLRTVTLVDDPNDQIKIVANVLEHIFRIISEMTYVIAMNTLSHQVPMSVKEKFINDSVDTMASAVKSRLFRTERLLVTDKNAVNAYNMFARRLRRSNKC